MKKLYTLLFLLLFIFSGVSAVEVSVSDAQKVAVNWKNSITKLKKGSSEVYKYTVSSYKGIKAFYTFKFKGGGYVIVSAENNIMPVLAYSDTEIAPDSITDGSVRYWLDMYKMQIYDVIVSKSDNLMAQKQWNNVINNTFTNKSGSSYGPLLTTTWGQGCYYNTMCPAEDAAPGNCCAHVPVGCVATAMAQIMRYHNYPVHGTGSHSYVSSYGTLSANFGTTNYDWGNMPNALTGENNAIATLGYHCGVGVDMEYTYNSSGAYATDCEYAFQAYFGYTDAALYTRGYYTDATWIGYLESNINENAPVLYCGTDPSAGGHAFVFDGYDNNDYMHVNWGWYGNYNGFYSINALKPGSYNFYSGQQVIGNLITPCSGAITAQGTTTFCQGGTVFLTASTGAGFSYQWQINNANISGATGSAYSATSSGNFRVVITNTGSCVSTTQTVTVTVNPLPNATTTPNGSVGLCQGNFLTLTSTTGTGFKYQWQKNSSNIPGATTSFYNLATSGTYSVIVTSSSNCTSTSTAVTVTLNPVPSPFITPQPSATFCAGENAILYANNDAGLTYQWLKNNAAISGSTNTQLSFISCTTANTGTYKVVETNASGCPATSQPVTLTVNPLPPATATPQTSTTFCPGDSVVLLANSGSGLSYQWQINGTDFPSATLSSFSAKYSGSYTVRVTNSFNCSAVSPAVAVTVSSSFAMSVTPLSATTFCLGDSVLLITGILTGATYQWQKDGTGLPGTNTYIYAARETGIYRVIASKAGCASTSDALSITANSPPLAVVSPQGNINLCTGSNVQLNAAAGTGITYQWMKNTVNISGATLSCYFANSSGTYSVCSKDNSTCASTSEGVIVSLVTPPAAAIYPQNSTVLCPGGPSSVLMNANSAPGYNYQWLSNGSAIIGASNSAFTAIGTGSYSVIVSNADNCSSTSSPVSVTTLSAAINSYNPVSICSGTNTILKSNTGKGFTYQWRKNSVNIAGAVYSSYSASQTADYTVIIKLGTSCTATSQEVTVYVIQPPSAKITAQGATSFCPSSPVSLILKANNDLNLKYQWKLNLKNISGATNSSYTASTVGSYTLVTSNYTGCSQTSSVLPVTYLTSSITPSGASAICQGSGIALKANPSNGFGYQWRKNKVNIQYATSSVYSCTAAGSYSVAISSGTTCSITSSTTTVTVNPVPAASATPQGSTTFCQGNSLTIKANSASNTLYQWKKNGVNITGATTTVLTVNASGNYSIFETNTFGCTRSSSGLPVVANPVPSLDLGPDVTINTTQTVNLDAGAGFAAYLWSNGSTDETISVNGQITGTGTFRYSVTVTNIYNCNATDSIHVIVKTAAKSAGSGSGNNTILNPADVHSLSGARLGNSYPNPFSRTAQIDYFLPADAQVSLKVFNIYGQLVSVLVDALQTKGNHNVIFSGENLSDGIYFYKLDLQGTCSSFTASKPMMMRR